MLTTYPRRPPASDLLERKRTANEGSSGHALPPLLNKLTGMLSLSSTKSAASKQVREIDSHVRQTTPADPGAAYRSIGVLLQCVIDTSLARPKPRAHRRVPRV